MEVAAAIGFSGVTGIGSEEMRPCDCIPFKPNFVGGSNNFTRSQNLSTRKPKVKQPIEGLLAADPFPANNPYAT